MITLTQLEYIVALDDLRHFASAADKCFVTQPTLSMQVKKLEEDLGIVIFDRGRQPLEPTAIGIKVIEQARAALASSERIKEIIKEERRIVEGELRMGIIPTLAPYLLPVLMKQFTSKYPNVKIQVEEVESEELVRRLKNDRLDTGIFVTPYEDDRIIGEPVFYEEMLVYAHPDHELLKKEEVCATDLDIGDLWLLGKGHCFRNQVLNLCKVAGHLDRSKPFYFESNSLETLMHVVDMEGGFTLIPELALQYMTPERQRQVRFFSVEKPLREVSVIYSTYYIKQQLVRLLKDEIRAVIPMRMQDAARGMIVEWKER